MSDQLGEEDLKELASIRMWAIEQARPFSTSVTELFDNADAVISYAQFGAKNVAGTSSSDEETSSESQRV